MENFQEKLNEFKSQIKRRKIQTDTSGILLFKDFLSKMEEWNVTFGFTENWVNKISMQHHFLNIVELIAPDLLKNVISLNDFRRNDPQKGDTFNLSSARGLDAGLIHALFCWDLFKNHLTFENFDKLPDPYAPIKALYLRGHFVNKSDIRTITIDDITAIKKQTDFRLPSLDYDFLDYDFLDYDFLDYIDSVCERNGGSGGIPNQERTNQLWEEFKMKKGY